MFFTDEQLARNPRAKQKLAKADFVPKKLKYFDTVEIPYQEFSDMTLLSVRGCTLIYDIECYPNYFLAAFKCPKTRLVVTFERSPDADFDRDKLVWVLNNFELVGFNTRKYDELMAWLAVWGSTNEQLKYASDTLITVDGMSGPKLAKEMGVKIPKTNQIDLIEVAPLRASLKTYAGRMHAPRMQDLPYDPAFPLSRAQARVVRFYCINDLDNTILLWKDLLPHLRLRVQLSEEYGQDLRSRSDAQIAEHVLTAECEKINGYFAKRPIIKPGTCYKYQPPPFIQFATPELQAIFRNICEADFVISEKGQPKCSYLKGLKVRIGASVYKMGVGGLHSSEKATVHYARDGWLLIDRDVASYYPAIILNNGFFPKHLKETFLQVYRSIVDRRLRAKGLMKSSDLSVAETNAIISESLKITINGSFGKLGSKWSALYSPDLLIQVTLTGQLALLMLIEALHNVGINTVSANTDGIVIKVHESAYDELNRIVGLWEKHTKFETEETQYSAVFSRDVNNYMAIKKYYDKKVKQWTTTYPELNHKGVPFKTSDKVKGKGVFGETTLKKQPTNEICAKAVAEFLLNGTSIAHTIQACKALSDFITVKSVKGGAEKDGWYLGKAIRWYYGRGMRGTINYVKNGNTVGNSEGATPCMDLPEVFPSDVDYDWYINNAEGMLKSMGYYGVAKEATAFDLFTSANVEDEHEEEDEEEESLEW